MGFFRPSGGLKYHVRAMLHQHEWHSFKRDLGHWLDSFARSSTSLILIAPSGGYTIPNDWLKKFSQIYAYDFDPLAPLFFRWQHRGLNLKFSVQDVFGENGQLSLNPLTQILEAHKDSAVLFSNVIGQLLLEYPIPDEDWLKFLLMLRQRLEGRTWASYHDSFTKEHGEIFDHLTASGAFNEWTKGLDQQELKWNLTPKSLHTIMAVQTSS